MLSKKISERVVLLSKILSFLKVENILMIHLKFMKFHLTNPLFYLINI